MTLDNHFYVSIDRETFWGFEMIPNSRDTSPLNLCLYGPGIYIGPFLFHVECSGALGMVSGRIKSNQVTASSSVSPLYSPGMARLNSSSAWCTSNGQQDQFIQVWHAAVYHKSKKLDIFETQKAPLYSWCYKHRFLRPHRRVLNKMSQGIRSLVWLLSPSVVGQSLKRKQLSNIRRLVYNKLLMKLKLINIWTKLIGKEWATYLWYVDFCEILALIFLEGIVNNRAYSRVWYCGIAHARIKIFRRIKSVEVRQTWRTNITKERFVPVTKRLAISKLLLTSLWKRS